MRTLLAAVFQPYITTGNIAATNTDRITSSKLLFGPFPVADPFVCLLDHRFRPPGPAWGSAFDVRVLPAMQRILGSRQWTEVQRPWLIRVEMQLMREMVVYRAAIDEELFHSM
jgi:hypothetical protein